MTGLVPLPMTVRGSGTPVDISKGCLQLPLEIRPWSGQRTPLCAPQSPTSLLWDLSAGSTRTAKAWTTAPHGYPSALPHAGSPPALSPQGTGGSGPPPRSAGIPTASGAPQPRLCHAQKRRFHPPLQRLLSALSSAQGAAGPRGSAGTGRTGGHNGHLRRYRQATHRALPWAQGPGGAARGGVAAAAPEGDTDTVSPRPGAPRSPGARSAGSATRRTRHRGHRPPRPGRGGPPGAPAPPRPRGLRHTGARPSQDPAPARGDPAPPPPPASPAAARPSPAACRRGAGREAGGGGPRARFRALGPLPGAPRPLPALAPPCGGRKRKCPVEAGRRRPPRAGGGGWRAAGWAGGRRGRAGAGHDAPAEAEPPAAGEG